MAAFKGILTQDFWRAVSAEFLATLIFVLLSLGSATNWPGGKSFRISVCFGLSIATMVQCFGHISGGHVNPAVTAAMVFTKKLSLAKAVFYVIAQCLGAIVGAGVSSMLTREFRGDGSGVTEIHPAMSLGHGLIMELFITFVLVFTMFATCDAKRNDLKGSSGLAIGLAVSIGHLFAVPYTGASMNPARSFGPAVVNWQWTHHWVYWVGPIMGGVLAATLYEYLFCPDPDLKRPFGGVFAKDNDPPAKYEEVADGGFRRDVDELAIGPGPVRLLDVEWPERKDRDCRGKSFDSLLI